MPAPTAWPRPSRPSAPPGDQHFVDVVGHDLHAVIAQLTGNPVLELVALVLIRLSRLHQLTPAGHRPEAIVEEVTRAHGRIVDAIVSGRSRPGPAPHAPPPRRARPVLRLTPSATSGGPP